GALIGLGLGLYGVLDAGKVSEAPVLVASTIVLALWNLVARRLQVWRLLAVLAIGGLQGLVFASALIGIGVPPDHLPPAILGFGAGNILPLVVVAFSGLALALLFSGGSHRKRGRVSVLASMLIAGAGVYWIVEPWVQG
ncbi:HupE/UreJ family protein, partial [Ruegeria sp. NA]|nr:HupE/UreJ family protein [Ruegeria sp. NA]